MIKKEPLPTSIILCLLTLAVAMVLASIHPLNFNDYLLHQAGTLIFLAFMWHAYHHLGATSFDFVAATLFLLLHIIGARYLYSYVPYDDWSQALMGIKFNEVFGWQRNMYDRLVHFAYGLCLLPMMLSIWRYFLPHTSNKLLIVIALQFNLATSAFYELIEWLLAMSVSPEAAEAYNGQQGDMWDAHKDMVLALLGGMVAAIMCKVLKK